VIFYVEVKKEVNAEEKMRL